VDHVLIEAREAFEEIHPGIDVSKQWPPSASSSVTGTPGSVLRWSTWAHFSWSVPAANTQKYRLA
jgi:hypothetical protein